MDQFEPSTHTIHSKREERLTQKREEKKSRETPESLGNKNTPKLVFFDITLNSCSRQHLSNKQRQRLQREAKKERVQEKAKKKNEETQSQNIVPDLGALSI